MSVNERSVDHNAMEALRNNVGLVSVFPRITFIPKEAEDRARKETQTAYAKDLSDTIKVIKSDKKNRLMSVRQQFNKTCTERVQKE